MSKNKKRSTLHFPGALNLTLQRHKFLDGTWTTYFGPGQKPDIIGTTYYNPTDWNRVNTVMRPPQVVWLEVRIEWSQSYTYYDYTGTASSTYTPTFVIGGETHAGADPAFAGGLGQAYLETPPILGLDPIYVFHPNVALAEKQRLVGVFESVKTTIEARRQGRTWVQVVNWHDDYDFQLATGFHSGEIERNFLPSPNFDSPWFLCEQGFVEFPDAFFPRLDYFGTDFLGIYCGTHYMYNGLFSGNGPTGDPAVELPESSAWQNIYGRLLANRDKFFGHSTRLYHPDLGWGSWAPPGPPFELAFTVAPGGIEWTSAPITDAGSTALDVYTGGVYDAAAGIAAVDEVDITHPGDTSMVTEDYLVNLIARHFGFNPDTGKDLG